MDPEFKVNLNQFTIIVRMPWGRKKMKLGRSSEGYLVAL